MAEAGEAVLYQIEEAVARVTLNRPEKRNALNEALIDGLKSSLRRASDDASVRVVVISGAGNDFCSGADLASLQKIADGSVTENTADARSLMELLVLMRQIKVPVVAAVRGKALAGGCGLASACDIVLASAEAQFGYPEVKIGFVPAMVLAILRRNVPEKLAFELLTRGEEINATQALELGLVNQVFEDESFDEDVASYVKRFQDLSKSAIALTKTLLYQIDGLSFVEALEAGADVNVIARLTEDCQRGVAKFLKK